MAALVSPLGNAICGRQSAELACKAVMFVDEVMKSQKQLLRRWFLITGHYSLTALIIEASPDVVCTDSYSNFTDFFVSYINFYLTCDVLHVDFGCAVSRVRSSAMNSAKRSI